MKMNTNMKALNMNELSISELETVSAGEMTREERQKVSNALAKASRLARF